jgi:hypothetical protein
MHEVYVVNRSVRPEFREAAAVRCVHVRKVIDVLRALSVDHVDSSHAVTRLAMRGRRGDSIRDIHVQICVRAVTRTVALHRPHQACTRANDGRTLMQPSHSAIQAARMTESVEPPACGVQPEPPPALWRLDSRQRCDAAEQHAHGGSRSDVRETRATHSLQRHARRARSMRALPSRMSSVRSPSDSARSAA